MSRAPNVNRALNHRLHGDLDGRVPVVLLHGVGSNLTAWDEVAPLLAQHRPVLRYDLRGHGDSPLREVPYTLDRFVADHLELTSSLGVTRAHVVGFSLGGLIAQAIALTYPQLVERLVVIGAVAGRTEPERQRVTERLANLSANGPGRPTDADRWFTASFLRAHPERVAANLARQATTNPAGYAAAYAVLATNDLIDQLADVTAPTLAMTGELDVGSPPHMSQTIATRVPNGRAVILRGYKHAVLDEIPQRIAEEIDGFLTD